MSRIGYKPVEAQVALYQSVAMLVEGVTDIVLELAGSNTSVGTIKVVGSIAEKAPDFSQVQSVANPYDFIQVIDVQDGTPINGDIGVGFTANDVRLVDVNTSGLRWLGVIVSAYTSGQFDVRMQGYADRK